MGSCTSRPAEVNSTAAEHTNEDPLEGLKTALNDVRNKHQKLEDEIDKLLDTAHMLRDTAKKYRVENKVEHAKEFLKRYNFANERRNKISVFRNKYQELIESLEQQINLDELVDVMQVVNTIFSEREKIATSYEEENDKLREFQTRLADTHEVLAQDVDYSEFNDIIADFDKDSMDEIATFLQKNTVQIVTTKFKGYVLNDFEGYIRDSIQQREHEVLLSTILEDMRQICCDCAHRIFDRLEQITKYIDYSKDKMNGSIYEEKSCVTTILAFSTDDAREFVRNTFTDVLVNWAYNSILMRDQVKEALSDGFDNAMREEIRQQESEALVNTPKTVFDSIAEHIVNTLSKILKEQFDKYASNNTIKQDLEKAVNDMASKIKKYVVPTTTTPPTLTPTSQVSDMSSLPQPVPSRPIVPISLPLPPPPPPPSVHPSFGVPPFPKIGKPPGSNASTSTISALPSRSPQSSTVKHSVAVLE